MRSKPGWLCVMLVATLVSITSGSSSAAAEEPAEKAARTFSARDRDGNKQLSIAEFLGNATANVKLLKRDFKLFDLDSDGALTLSDVHDGPLHHAACVPNGAPGPGAGIRQSRGHCDGPLVSELGHRPEPRD